MHTVADSSRHERRSSSLNADLYSAVLLANRDGILQRWWKPPGVTQKAQNEWSQGAYSQMVTLLPLQIKELLDQGKELVVLLAEFYPSDRHYTGFLVEYVSGCVDEEVMEGPDDSKAEGKFVMLVQFMNGLVQNASKKLGLEARSEVDAFVCASKILKEKGQGHMNEEDDAEQTGGLKKTDEAAESETEPVINSQSDNNSDENELAIQQGRNAMSNMTNSEQEQYLSKVVQALTMADANESESKYHAQWLESHYWLVD